MGERGDKLNKPVFVRTFGKDLHTNVELGQVLANSEADYNNLVTYGPEATQGTKTRPIIPELRVNQVAGIDYEMTKLCPKI